MRNRRNNKLDSVDVVSIRASNLSRKQLAAKYKVNVSTIQRVIVGTRWG
jgi:DNA-binding transcriptional regulator YiaG